MPPAKKGRKSKISITSRAFYDELKINPVAITRITREAIDNKATSNELLFKYEAENVRVFLGEDREIEIESVWVNGRPNGNYKGDQLPEIFRTRMKYYLSNLNWTLETVKLIHELKDGTFFEVLNLEGELDEEPVVYSGWRGVLFFYTRRGLGNVCVFYPLTGEVERLTALPPKLADDLCCMLSNGLCFDCRVKIGPGKFCSYHPYIMRSYGN